MNKADMEWANSHRYGCKCGSGKENDHIRTTITKHDDGSRAPCGHTTPCPTATAEWNAVRAAFANAEAIDGRVSLMLEEFIEPLRELSKNVERIAYAINVIAEKDPTD